MMKKNEFSQESIDKALNAGIESGVNLDVTYFEQSTEFIERNLKQEIARMVWNPDARYRVIHTNDTELVNALSYFDEAADLLARRLAIGDL